MGLMKNGIKRVLLTLVIAGAFGHPLCANDGTVNVETAARATGPWVGHPTRLLELLDGYASQPPVTTDKYGGRTDQPGGKATGFFRVEKVKDRWWFIDPDGNPYYNLALTHVRPSVTPSAKRAFKAKYPDEIDWSKKTADFLWGTGFNGLGNSSAPGLHTVARPFPYVENVGFMAAFGKEKDLARPATGHSGYVNDCIPVFHPDFPAFCDRYAKALAAAANDPYLVGIFSDNELLMPLDLLDRNLALDVNNPDLKPGHDAALAWLTAQGKDPAKITDRDRKEFIGYAFGLYYKIVSAAVHKHDPHHLYMGTRLNERGDAYTNDALWRNIGPYTDVVSVNYYFVWEPVPEQVNHWVEWGQKPIVISEWYAKAMDAKGLASRRGAGWRVKTQEDRAKFYQTYLLGCFESGKIIGAQYFQYQDDPADTTDRDAIGGCNKGFVDTNYAPYAPLVQRAKAVNLQVYSLIDFFDRRKSSR